MAYGHAGSMRTRSGHRDEVVSILLTAAEGLRAAGCTHYIVTVSATEAETIWVFEVWESKEHHEASLQLPGVKEAIARAMPMLTGEFTGHELDVVGGLGVEADPAER